MYGYQDRREIRGMRMRASLEADIDQIRISLKLASKNRKYSIPDLNLNTWRQVNAFMGEECP